MLLYGAVLQWETLRSVWTELPTSVEAWHVSSSLLATASSTVRTSTCNATAVHHREPSVPPLSCRIEHPFFMHELLSLSPLSVTYPKPKDLQITRSLSPGDNHTVKWLSKIQTCHERLHICAWNLAVILNFKSCVFRYLPDEGIIIIIFIQQITNLSCQELNVNNIYEYKMWHPSHEFYIRQKCLQWSQNYHVKWTWHMISC